MAKKYPLLILFALLIFSCEKDSPEFSLLTVEVEQNAVAAGEEKWVYITEPAGKLLDIRRCENGGSFELKGPMMLDEVDVTIFRFTSVGFKSSVLATYLGVSSGKTLIIPKAQQFENLAPVGSATLEISNYSETVEPAQMLILSNGLASTGIKDLSTAGTDVNYTFDIFENPQDLLVTSFRNGQRVYFRQNEVTPGQQIVADYAFFDAYEEVFEIPAEFHEEGKTIGYDEDGRSFLLGYASSSLNFGDTPSLGYIDGYETYFTGFNKFDGNISATYSKKGERATDVVIPDVSMLVEDETPDNFRFATDVDYTYASAQWTYSPSPTEGVFWFVQGDAATSLLIKTIPDKVLEKHPGMKLSNLEFWQLSCTQRMDDFSYTDLVDLIFKTEEEEQFEIFVFSAYSD